ncbi:phage holin family protein [Fodinibacter luteus]|uniref:Phage holin family protein n=1 Tax=Fodinibacter luteus TaxID=552064 RepID=A0ABP8JWC5_9MICO
MSARPTGRRPLAVTIVVVLTVLQAVGNLVLGVLVVAAAPEATPMAGLDPAQTVTALRIVGVVLVVLGLLQLGIAVLLARGVNGARLATTLVLLAQQAHSWTVLDGLPARRVEGFSGLALAVVIVFLLWNPSTSTWFDRHREEALAETLNEPGHQDPDRRSGARVLDFLLRLTVLGATIALAPGIEVESTASLLLAVVMISFAGWLLQPFFLRVALVFGWFGAVLLALFANAAVIGIGLYVTPGVTVSSVLSAVAASWIYAFVMTLLTWAFSINGRDYLTVHAMRMGAKEGEVPHSDVPGVVFVQLDGVPAPLLQNEIRAGNIPTISRWIRSGSHTWTEWTARVPSTTPVSQAGLLHGVNDGIPAFRWFDRELGRLVVANKPADAALIESRVSTGHGLLADGGVSISNLFSGDAPTSLLTMSGLKEGRRGLGPSSSYAAFFTHPAGILRAVILTVGEMVKEVFQARRQVRRGVEPRIHRGGAYVALRAATNVFLRDLNVALVVEAMMRGSKSVYVDFVDYDEVAHHAGVTRAESLAALYGLDEALRSIEQVIDSGITPRPYHVVLVSDHGQSQGATFLQRYGTSLEDLVLQHLHGDATVTAATGEIEAWGPVNLLLGQLSGQDSVSGRLTKRAIADRDPQAPVGPSGVVEDTSGPGDAPAELTVVGSGNLGGVWFSRHPERLTATDIERLHPGLLAALSAHPGIGFVVVLGDAGPVALGAAGTHDLATGEVVGDDPLAPFGPDAVGDFLHVSAFPNAPDIYVNSLYDPVLDEVAAFEELVGCHGGLGGWQTRPLLVHPAEWPVDADLLDERGRLRGADTVHRQLVRWLERLGHRTDLPADAGTAERVKAPG